ncbi:hypothetical protein [Granulicella tundricola]|uniref:Uncharacterized protein n=1 Tax=Granulicella tundricola (strain ATCC BAA-1859 / DSM 23138 / MP5ACTX9) TaxID=1198114 RepID=E8X6M3_GRATM|nr:hypothetical protein [Granulicella tundricola]ADW71173.1 hypothetical protein AciX9_3895 [Granulicella tundricola MP5ACTX9]
MVLPILNTMTARSIQSAQRISVAAILFCAVRYGLAQDTPFLSGGVGFLTATNAGKTTYIPTIQPLLAAPIGPHLLIESRAALVESFSPAADGKYDHNHFIALTYLQGDYTVSSHLTVVGGSFLLPFGTYNERLTPIWISNFSDAPLNFNLGQMSSAIGTGGMLRGSAISRRKYSIDYAAFFSSRVGNQQFAATRASGGRASLYLPEKRLEIGFSYDRSLQGIHENFYGMHVWWEPKDTAFRLRSEFTRGHHAQGYWIEGDYRLQKLGGSDSWIGRIEPVIRMQQTFRRDTLVSDGLPLVNTERIDLGLDYNLPHNTRILTSYARQFSAAGNENVWETGIVYRFLFPAWKGK